MKRFVTAKENDLPAIEKCLRRCEQSCIDEGISAVDVRLGREQILDAVESGSLLLIKDGAMVLGMAWFLHDLSKAFFPLSNSERKSIDLLDEYGWNGEPIIVFRAFMIDPMVRNEGNGRELMQALLARFKGASFFASFSLDNPTAATFYRAMGFEIRLTHELEIEKETARNLAVRMFKPSGLCREARW